MNQGPLRHDDQSDMERALKESLKFYELRAGGAKRTLFSAWTQPIPIITNSRQRSTPEQLRPGSASNGAESANDGGIGADGRAGQRIALPLFLRAVMLARVGWRRTWLSFGAAVVNLGLNVVFIALDGIGGLGIVLIAMSTLVAVAVGALSLRGLAPAGQ